MPNQEHEREREIYQTHSYWYIPSTLRVKYSLLVMESAGMMKMATGDDSPLRKGAGTGSRLVFGGYRGLRRRNSRSRFLFGGFFIYRNFWRRFHVRGPTTRQQGWGAPLGGRGALHPCGAPVALLAQLFCFGGFFWSTKNHRKFSCHLDSV